MPFPSHRQTDPALFGQWLAGQDTEVEPIVVRWKNKALASLAVASLIRKEPRSGGQWLCGDFPGFGRRYAQGLEDHFGDPHIVLNHCTSLDN